MPLHEVFFGETADAHSLAWRNLKNYCARTFTLPGVDAEVYITRVGVDASYNPNKDPGVSGGLRMEMNAVYAFCKENPARFIPVRGVEDKQAAQLIAQKKHSRYGIYFYVVDVTALKDELFENIDLKEGGRALHFTADYKDEFFKQFVSEVYTEGDDGRMYYKKIYERNETLDTYIYARAVMSILGADRWDENRWDEWRLEMSE